MLALLLAAALASGPALAEKPSWAGNGKGDHADKGSKGGNAGKGNKSDRSDGKGQDDRSNQGDRGGRDGRDGQGRSHFEDRHRVALQDYYGKQFHAGRCPPGLAKKHNGCMPPGQARKWQVGHRLPSDVIYYTVPQPLVLQFGPPPSGHRYVRVAADILLIAIGTGMVVDAIQSLSRS